MHWIKTIRENLHLSREDLAHYLRLSPHTIRSVERDKRQLSQDSLRPALTLDQAIKDLPSRGPVSDLTAATDYQIRHVKRLHRECRRRLERCTDKLEEMQRAHADACSCFDVYQLMAHGETEPDRLKWIQWKIAQTIQQIKDNNATMQNLLVAEIAGVKSMTQALEGSIDG